LQSLEIPGSVARFTKKNAAHVVVDAVDCVALPLKILHGFGTDESARPSDQDGFCFHVPDTFCRWRMPIRWRSGRVRFRKPKQARVAKPTALRLACTNQRR